MIYSLSLEVRDDLTLFPPFHPVFLRIMKGINSPHLNANNWQHWVIWLSCVTFNVTIAYIIAEVRFMFSFYISFPAF